MDSTAHELSRVLVELGLVVIGLAFLARIASRWAFSAIPLYLLAGLAFGNGGLAPLNLSGGFVHIGAEIGVLLLLFMLGLDYTGGKLTGTYRDYGSEVFGANCDPPAQFLRRWVFTVRTRSSRWVNW